MAVSHLVVFIRGETGKASAAPGFETVSIEFPSVGFELGEIENLPSLSLTAEEWESSRFPFYEFDAMWKTCRASISPRSLDACRE